MKPRRIVRRWLDLPARVLELRLLLSAHRAITRGMHAHLLAVDRELTELRQRVEDLENGKDNES